MEPQNTHFVMTNLRRVFVFVSTLMLLASASAQNTVTKPVEWLTLSEAASRNQTEPRKIFVDVFTDWCGWCKKMDATTFADTTVAALFNRHFRAVKLDAEGSDTIVFAGHTFVNPKPGERRSTHQLAAALLNGKMSYPSFVFLDEQNRLLTTLAGYQPADRLADILRYFGQDIYKTMSWEQYIKQKEPK